MSSRILPLGGRFRLMTDSMLDHSHISGSEMMFTYADLNALREMHDVDSKPFHGLYSSQYGVLFLHIPKTAGTSIRKILDMPGGAHFRLSGYQQKIDRLDPVIFTVVRDPVDRYLSAYRYIQAVYERQKKQLPRWTSLCDEFRDAEEMAYQLDIARFLEIGADMFMPQSYFINPRMPHYERVQILTYEQLAHDWMHFVLHNRIPVKKRLHHLNRTMPERRRCELSREAMACLSRFYAIDDEQFGYVRSEIEEDPIASHHFSSYSQKEKLLNSRFWFR